MKEENKKLNASFSRIINEKLSGLIRRFRKEQGVSHKELAEGTGISGVGLSLILSEKNEHIISTRKLIEVGTVLNKHLVIGYLSDEEIVNFNNKLSDSTPINAVVYCPNCGKSLKIEEVSEPKDLASNFVVCDFINIDMDAKQQQRERRKETMEKRGLTIGQKRES